MSAYLLNKLHRVAVEAVEHVAKGTCSECWERQALAALDAAFEAAHDGRASDIVFRLCEQETQEVQS